MPQVISGPPKDIIDEMIEKANAVDRILAVREQTEAVRDTRDALGRASDALVTARAAASRIYVHKPTAA